MDDEIRALRESLDASVSEERRQRGLYQELFAATEKMRSGICELMAEFVAIQSIPVGIRADISKRVHELVPVGTE